MLLVKTRELMFGEHSVGKYSSKHCVNSLMSTKVM